MNSNIQYTIRKATSADLKDIMRLVKLARQIMCDNGNTTQWTNGYPSEETIKADIDSGTCYLVVNGNDAVGSFVLKPGPDPTYNVIYDGQWKDECRPYHVIHRITSAPSAHGIFSAIIGYCQKECDNIRIDTHEKNTIMRHLIMKYGFDYCGIIICSDGTDQLAYQWTKPE